MFKYFIILIFFTSTPIMAGLVHFMPESEVESIKEILPTLSNNALNAGMLDPDTSWYDEESMVFLYQDSVETVVGARANRVGREVGENNRNNPGIAKLLNYFGEDKKFRFPFRGAAGVDDTEGVKVVNFWLPPKKDGKYMPVKWWKASKRGRWHWTFPNGTLFGEVLMHKTPKGNMVPFEVRTRKKYAKGWAVDLFRPYTSASQLADKIIQLRPDWSSNNNIRSFVNYLRDSSTLKKFRLESTAFKKSFEAVDGALDYLPELKDSELLTELMNKKTFESAQGKIWKENGTLETYAPSSNAEFSIVPKNYQMGVIPVNEISCNRCHNQTGRGLGDFDGEVVLYGEIWGEDRAFTWHLFKPHRGIYGTFDDADGSRIINPELQNAGLLLNEKPSLDDPDYRPFKPWKLLTN